MPCSANILPVSAASAFIASRSFASGLEPQPQPAAVTDSQHVVARDVLAVLRAVARHVGGRIAALAVGDAAVGACEEPHLRLPGAVVAGIFMHKDDGRAAARFLVIQPDRKSVV